MNLGQRLGLRGRLVLVLLAAFAALGALLAWHLVRDHAGQVDQVKAKLLDQARLVAARQEVLVERADAVLDGLLLNPALGPDSSDTACAAQLAELLKHEAAYAHAGVARASGDVRCSGVSAAAPVNLADRAWFQQTLKSEGLVVGDIIVSRIVGKPVITLSKAVRGANGQVAAVFYLALSLDWMRQAVAKAGLQAGVRLAVMDRSGEVTARFPDPEAWAGAAVAGSILRRVLDAGGEGTLEDMNRAGERG